MPNGTTTDHGRVLLSWIFPEFEKHHRSIGWYTLAGLVVVSFLVWALLTQNYLFAVFVVVASLLVYRQGTRDPGDVLFSITEDGIDVGGQHFYSYKELGNFWMIYEPPTIKKLFFTFKSGVRPDLIVPLMDQNPVTVRRMFTQYLPEDFERESEPTSEAIGRALKI